VVWIGDGRGTWDAQVGSAVRGVALEVGRAGEAVGVGVLESDAWKGHGYLRVRLPRL
jgi:hypothetical protein